LTRTVAALINDDESISDGEAEIPYKKPATEEEELNEGNEEEDDDDDESGDEEVFVNWHALVWHF
jgi:hypothetical protein